jgi:hypothetical protein
MKDKSRVLTAMLQLLLHSSGAGSTRDQDREDGRETVASPADR